MSQKRLTLLMLQKQVEDRLLLGTVQPWAVKVQLGPELQQQLLEVKVQLGLELQQQLLEVKVQLGPELQQQLLEVFERSQTFEQ
jgi:hypothetical protein